MSPVSEWGWVWPSHSFARCPGAPSFPCPLSPAAGGVEEVAAFSGAPCCTALLRRTAAQPFMPSGEMGISAAPLPLGSGTEGFPAFPLPRAAETFPSPAGGRLGRGGGCAQGRPPPCGPCRGSSLGIFPLICPYGLRGRYPPCVPASAVVLRAVSFGGGRSRFSLVDPREGALRGLRATCGERATFQPSPGRVVGWACFRDA